MVIALVHESGLEIDLRRRSYLSVHYRRKVFEVGRGIAPEARLKFWLSWFGGPWQGVALKPGLCCKVHNHARQDGNLPVLPRARHTPTRDAFPLSALSRMHYHRYHHGCPGSTHRWCPRRLSYLITRNVSGQAYSTDTCGHRHIRLLEAIRAAAAKTDTPANPGSASKPTNLLSKIKTYLTGMHPTSVHLMGGCLMGVYLTGVCILRAYLS